MRPIVPLSILLIALPQLFGSCSTDAPPTTAAIANRDSLPVMVSYGVSKIISDSGLMRYKLITEEWQVYDKTTPAKHIFPKGLYLQQMDDKFGVTAYLTADTAYWFDQRLWHLCGRVVMRTEVGRTFRSEELYWDMSTHEFYSTKYGVFTDGDAQRLAGYNFRFNETMTRYSFDNGKGYRPLRNSQSASSSPATNTSPSDSVASTPTRRSGAEMNKRPRLTPSSQS